MKFIFDFDRYDDYNDTDIVGLSYKVSLVVLIEERTVFLFVYPISISFSFFKSNFFSFLLLQGYVTPPNIIEPASFTYDATDSSAPRSSKGSSSSSVRVGSTNGTVPSANNIQPTTNTANNNRTGIVTTAQNPLYEKSTAYPNHQHYDSALNRYSPEGKDSESVLLAEKNKNQQLATVNNNNSQKLGNEISTEFFSASNDNGQINVQVTVLVGEFYF